MSGSSALNGKPKENKSHSLICQLMCDGIKPSDDSDRYHWTNGRKTTPSFKRYWRNKEQFVWKAKSLALDWDCNRSQRTLKMSRAVPILPICPLMVTLVCPFSTIFCFLSPLLFSPIVTSSASASSISFSDTMLLFNLCWILQSIFAPAFLPPFSVLSHLILSHLCQGIDLDSFSHKGDVTQCSNTPQSLF